MNPNKRPQFLYLVMALEAVFLAGLLFWISPLGERLAASDRVRAERQEAERGEADGDDRQGAEHYRKGDVTGTQQAESSVSGTEESGTEESKQKDYIKWVDFHVTAEAMNDAFRKDVDSYQKDVHLDWIELLAYLGARYGGDFSRYKKADMDAVAQRLADGEKMEEITADMKYYKYYQEAYRAVLGGMVGEYRIEIPGSDAPDFALPKDAEGNPVPTDEPVWVTKYGLKAFHPIAKNFPYSEYDDFGVARSYGFRRQHLGHDMMGQVGTPVIAVESGYVEAMGWNQYGGWRLGIRSFDGKRYYYYAHLRKNFPYRKSLKEGSIVQAGDVIGYLGRTGYSAKENTNNIDDPHLHFGMQLIFDESQKEGNNEIWISCYEISKFLTKSRSETVKKQETKEYYRKYQMQDPAAKGAAEQRIPADDVMQNETPPDAAA